MIALDVNILLYAHREDAPRHAEYLKWLEEQMDTSSPVLFFEPVLSGVIRIATHPSIYKTPSPLRSVVAFIEEILAAKNAVRSGLVKDTGIFSKSFA